MSTYAQVEHVEEPFRRLTMGEIPTVQSLLDRAERLVLRRVDVEARIAVGRLTALDVRDVLVEMCLRVMRNPSGTTSQTTGPFSQVLDRSVASGRLELTRGDRENLGMVAGAATIAVADPAMPRVVRRPYWRAEP